LTAVFTTSRPLGTERVRGAGIEVDHQVWAVGGQPVDRIPKLPLTQGLAVRGQAAHRDQRVDLEEQHGEAERAEASREGLPRDHPQGRQVPGRAGHRCARIDEQPGSRHRVAAGRWHRQRQWVAEGGGKTGSSPRIVSTALWGEANPIGDAPNSETDRVFSTFATPWSTIGTENDALA
jgi:hypothetical protein